MHPRIRLILGGSLISVQFGDAVTICARGVSFFACTVTFYLSHADNDYKDRVALKSASDRTLGLGVIEDQAQLLILTASTMMKATIDTDEVAQFDPEYNTSYCTKLDFSYSSFQFRTKQPH